MSLVPSLLPLLSGCNPVPPPPTGATMEPPAAVDDLAARGTLPWRQVWLAPEPLAACPAIDGWTGDPLFPLALREEGDTPAPALARFCVYETSLTGSDLDRAVDGLATALRVTPGDTTTLSPDLAVVAPAWGLQAAYGPAYRDRTEAMLGVPAFTPPAASPPEVWLLDSIADDADLFRQQPGSHGHALANLLRAWLCPSAATPAECPVGIRAAQAMPLLGDDGLHPSSPPKPSGAYGTLTTLATALDTVIAAADADPHRNRVVNLSLGWVPELTATSSGTLAAAQAVRVALRGLQCRGALVFAAAGNRVGGGLDSGPLLPAGWSDDDTDLPACSAVLPPGHPAMAEAGNRDGQPMLHAVAALDRNAAAHPTARPGSLPLLAAPGDHLAALDVDGNELEPRSGSSLGAAVASALAAMRWTDAPTEDPFALAQELVADAPALPLQADIVHRALSHLGNQVHRLDLCTGLPTTGAAGTYHCSRQPVSTVPLLDGAAAASWEQAATHLSASLVTHPDDPCRGSPIVRHPDGVTPAVTCLEATYASAAGFAPWVVPQPEDTSCPYCPPTVTATAFVLRIDDPDLTRDTWGAAALLLDYSDGTNTWTVEAHLPLGAADPDGWRIELGGAGTDGAASGAPGGTLVGARMAWVRDGLLQEVPVVTNW